LKTSPFDRYVSKHIVSSSDPRFKTLVFESKALLKEYENEEVNLNKKYYDLICKTSGYWASNQDKFVSDPLQFNEWDIR
jgi:hypothetical protein